MATDHKSLLEIFNNDDLGSTDNRRIQLHKESTLSGILTLSTPLTNELEDQILGRVIPEKYLPA